MQDSQLSFLENLMDVSTVKRKANADNIANYNTPNFKATKVEFESLFEASSTEGIKVTNDKHITSFHGEGSPLLVKDTATKDRYDGNNVDLNQEMVDMIKNNYMYSMSVQAINKQFTLNKIALGR